MKEVLSTVVSDGEGPPQSQKMRQVHYSSTYTQDRLGLKKNIESGWTYGDSHSKITLTGDLDCCALALPADKMQPNKKYTIEIDSTVKGVPEHWLEETPKVKVEVVLKEKVKFDGQEAYKLQSESVGYCMLDLKISFINNGMPFYAKAKAHNSYY
jgi:hypothetical protein